MVDLLSHFWAWLLSAFLVGILTGVSSNRPPQQGGTAKWLIWFALAFAAGLPVALVHALSGRQAVWLESGLAAFAAFMAGCGIGAVLAGRPLRYHEAWAVGLVPAALIWWGSNLIAGQSLESELRQKVAAVVEGAPLAFEIAGRDVLLPKGASDRLPPANEVERVPGVRKVVESESLASAAEKPAQQALAEAPAKTRSLEWETEERSKPEARSQAETAGGRDAEAAARAEPDETARSAEEAAAVLAALPPSGQLDAANCQAALSATIEIEKIQFRDESPVIRRVSSGLMEKLTRFLKRCPEMKVEIAAHTGGGGDDQLSRRRAERVADYLVRMGVERDRLEPIGYGASRPLATNETAEGRSRNARIEFVVQQRR